MVRYCLSNVAPTVTLGVSQPFPLTEILTQDLKGETTLAVTTSSRTFPHYGNMKSEWRER
jgi:hypothetical protein